MYGLNLSMVKNAVVVGRCCYCGHR